MPATEPPPHSGRPPRPWEIEPEDLVAAIGGETLDLD